MSLRALKLKPRDWAAVNSGEKSLSSRRKLFTGPKERKGSKRYKEVYGEGGGGETPIVVTERGGRGGKIFNGRRA